ncbi:MAG TPA: hypothetical protein PLT36_06535 [Erysipelotrichaceae bacterium]|jgi:hypothetical protein|nr:hypothetical protein [Erysipelotrichia bacterium]HPX33144.1 hypothetical protein [Erysipelotrichaceae bacterium]HQA85605.1 hypothetical protein [Erysipelotrichaceae bacterium]
MKKTKKGSILLEAIISLMAITMTVAILINVVTVQNRIVNLKQPKDMNKYWRNIERFKLYSPIELPVDIVLSN